MLYRLLNVCYFFCVLALVGCASGHMNKKQDAPGITTQSSAPASEASADWENLGVTPNGNVLNEIDKLSIQREGTQVTFRDRKTIFDVKKENFLATPPHKVSLNTWIIDCAHRTFRLLNMVLLGANGRQIASFSYTGAQLKPTPIVKNSASYQQMLYVCPGSLAN